LTSAAHADILNHVAFLRIQDFPENDILFEECLRILNNLNRIPPLYEFWQAEPKMSQLASEDPAAEVYKEVLQHRVHLKGMAENSNANFDAITRDLFDMQASG